MIMFIWIMVTYTVHCVVDRKFKWLTKRTDFHEGFLVTDFTWLLSILLLQWTWTWHCSKAYTLYFGGINVLEDLSISVCMCIYILKKIMFIIGSKRSKLLDMCFLYQCHKLEKEDQLLMLFANSKNHQLTKISDF